MIKRVFPFAVIAVLILGGLTSCHYEEGPGISLRGRSERLANTWKVESAIDQDGDDNTAAYDDAVFTFEKDGPFEGQFDLGILGVLTYDGSWVFTNDDLSLEINSSATVIGITYNFQTTYDILRLKENELWIEETDGDFELIKLVPKE